MIAFFLSLLRRDPFGLEASLKQRKQLRMQGYARVWKVKR